MRKGFSTKEASRILILTHTIGIEVYITLIVGFLLEPYSPIYNNPEEFKLENLRPEYNGEHRNYFAFDEINGLRWKRKVKQQRKAYYQVLKAVYYNIYIKYLSHSWIPFWIWLVYRKNKNKLAWKYLKINKKKLLTFTIRR